MSFTNLTGSINGTLANFDISIPLRAIVNGFFMLLSDFYNVRFLKYPFFINLLQQLHNIPKIPITIKFVPSVVCGEKEFFSLPSKANRSYLFLFLSSSVNLCTVFFPPWQKLMKSFTYIRGYTSNIRSEGLNGKLASVRLILSVIVFWIL